MGKIIKYILYTVLVLMIVLWFMQVFKACNNSGNKISEATTNVLEETKDQAKNLKEKISDNDDGASDGEDLIVYNETDEGFGEDEDDEFLDEYEGTDNTLEEDEAAEKEALAKAETAAAEEEKRLSELESEAAIPPTASDTDEAETETYRSKGSASAGGKYMVIAGSFENPANARTLVKQLDGQGYPNAEIVKFDFSRFHAVCVNRYDAKSEADALAANLKKINIPAYVHVRKSKK